jgi:hypothetical protein
MFNNVLWKMVPFMRDCRKMLQSRTGNRGQYGACALHAGNYGYTHTHSDYLILIAKRCNNRGTNVPQCDVTSTLSVEINYTVFAIFSIVTCKHCIEIKEFSFAHGL